MNKIQTRILELSKTEDIFSSGLRPLARKIDADNPPNPQLVKHHLFQLQKNGLIQAKSGKDIKRALVSMSTQHSKIINVPLVGKANCGTATWMAVEEKDQWLPISESLLKKTHNVFALQAVGHSMNNANVGGKPIEDGDYVIVDFDNKSPNNNDYVLSVINGSANIKKFLRTRDDHIALVSESRSQEDYPPIIMSENDSFMINGKVIQVIKTIGEMGVKNA
jgi:SOS-response transcriptional repressor LexA